MRLGPLQSMNTHRTRRRVLASYLFGRGPRFVVMWCTFNRLWREAAQSVTEVAYLNWHACLLFLHVRESDMRCINTTDFKQPLRLQ